MRKLIGGKILHDHISGATTQRSALDETLTYLRKRDILRVWRLDRRGRFLKHLLEWVNSLEERGIGCQRLQESLGATNHTPFAPDTEGLYQVIETAGK